MEKANVLVIGNSGVGKSTLINSIFKARKARTGVGEAVTKRLEIYESPQMPFRIIDTIGFEYSVIKQWQAIRAVKKWSKDSINKDEPEKQIHIIWYCVDATSRKMFGKNIDMLVKAISVWKKAPVIAVLTKSYSDAEAQENIRMVQDAFSAHKKAVNLKAVIPVVAQAFKINDENIVPSKGLPELIEITNQHVPEAMRLSEAAKEEYLLNQKRLGAQGLTMACTATAVTVGAVPIPFPDAFILSGVELGLVKGISKIYGINSDKEKATKLVQYIVEAGTVSTFARGAINGLKAIPGINVAASVLNATVAGTITATIGEVSVLAMEKVYKGEADVNNLDWVDKLFESEFSKTFLLTVQNAVGELKEKEKPDVKEIASTVIKIFKAMKKK